MSNVMDGQKRPVVGWPTMIAYGAGAMSQSIKTRAISVFLLLYYSQVIGLEPALVSSLIFLAVLLDAVIDPSIGQWSDNFRSRWGRRHPFMYAAALPVPILFFLLWNPPTDWDHGAIAIYMIAILIALRV
ncbi:MAG: MFS transporter, partial [Caulobacterales bacterium]